MTTFSTTTNNPIQGSVVQTTGNGCILATSRMNKSTTVSNIYCNGKYNYLIITPAVSIDQNYDNGNANYYIEDDDDIDINLTAQSIINNNDNSDRSTENSQTNLKSSMVILNQRSNLMPKRTRSHSWRWCTLLCSAIKCFGNSTGFSATAASVAANSTSYTNNNIARNFVTSDNNVVDLIVTNETQCKNENIPYDL